MGEEEYILRMGRPPFSAPSSVAVMDKYIVSMGEGGVALRGFCLEYACVREEVCRYFSVSGESERGNGK